MLGNRTAIFVYMVLAVGLEFIVWFVPSIVSGGVAISLAGLGTFTRLFEYREALTYC